MLSARSIRADSTPDPDRRFKLVARQMRDELRPERKRTFADKESTGSSQFWQACP